jgi:hypothetical protein
MIIIAKRVLRCWEEIKMAETERIYLIAKVEGPKGSEGFTVFTGKAVDKHYDNIETTRGFQALLRHYSTNEGPHIFGTTMREVAATLGFDEKYNPETARFKTIGDSIGYTDPQQQRGSLTSVKSTQLENLASESVRIYTARLNNNLGGI